MLRLKKTSCNRPSDDNTVVPFKVCSAGNLYQGFGFADHWNQDADKKYSVIATQADFDRF